MTDYVAGFAFDGTGEHVLLVRKTHPTWQAGKLNGIGGKIEPGETPAVAMVREFAEEAAIDTDEASWRLVVTLHSGEHTIWFFAATLPLAVLRAAAGHFNDTGEPIGLWPVRALPGQAAIPNLSWLVPLAAYRHDTYEPITVIETGRPGPPGPPGPAVTRLDNPMTPTLEGATP